MKMSLPTNNKNNGKPGSKGPKGGMGQGSKFIAKPSGAKAIGGGKKPIKTGGSRGSLSYSVENRKGEKGMMHLHRSFFFAGSNSLHLFISSF
jgi:hypothetical protein